MNYAEILKPGSNAFLKQVEPDFEFHPQLCSDCIWKIQGTVTCLAFSQGIPLPILLGVYDHHAPYSDGSVSDSGVTYVPESEIEADSPPVQLMSLKLESERGDLTSNLNVIQYPHGGSLAQILKADPFHDREGKFTNKAGAVSTDWKKVGNQMGSNSGGVYTRGGVKHYVKFPYDNGQIYAEAAADKMYGLMGVKTMDHQPIKVNGKTASVSVMQEVKPLGKEGWEKLTDPQKQQAADVFVASALTKNWDVVGMEYDNMGLTKEGHVAILDTGGSFKHRAMGQPKPYDKDPLPEIEGMLSKTKTSGRVFGPLMEQHREMFMEAAKKLKSVSDTELVKIANTMRDNTLGQTVLARKKAILDHFGVS